jgi:hypothetical protein
MRSRDKYRFLRLAAVGLFSLLLLGNSSAWASDPLDDTDGTEGWDQVIQPKSKAPVQVEAERNTFKREVADWETIRQLWQTERERYLAEKGSHQRLLKRLKASKRPAPEADITENTDWGDESGDAWMEPSTGGSLDRLIDDELDESGAMPSKHPPKSAKTDDAGFEDGEESATSDSIPSAFKQPRERDTAEEKARKQEEEAAAAAAKLLEEQRKQERLEELAKKHKLEEERRKKEEEARAGEAAAAALLKQQEEEIRREEEALRKKAKLKVDKEGQVVDPDLQTEMNEEEEEEE